MPASTTWPKVLEEQAYLVQMLSEAAHDTGALEHTCALLDIFRDDLRSCTTQVAELERENQDRLKLPDSKQSSSASRFCHRFSGTKGSDITKQMQSQSEKQEQLLAGWTMKRTLVAEVKNLEIKAQILQRRTRHYNELQSRLSALYAGVFDPKRPLNRDIDEADANARSAQRTLHDAQKTLDQQKIVAALLTQGHFALINAAHHLTTAESPDGSTQVDAAKKCAMQTFVVLDQAKRINPSLLELEKDADVLKETWFSDVFNQTSPISLQPVTLVQALKLHHTALLSIISRAHKRTAEQKAVAGHATHKCMEARTRKDALRRRALVAFANAEAQSDVRVWSQGDLAEDVSEADASGNARDITAGLDGVIPVVVSQRPPFPTPTSSIETHQRVLMDQPTSYLLPLAQPQPRLHPSNNLLQGLILDSDEPPSATFTDNTDDVWIQVRSASADMQRYQSSPVPYQPPLTPQFDRQFPGSAPPVSSLRLQPQTQTIRLGDQESATPQFQPQSRTLSPVSRDVTRLLPLQPPQQLIQSAQPPVSRSPNINSDTLPRHMSPDLSVAEAGSVRPNFTSELNYHQRPKDGVSSLRDSYPATRDSGDLPRMKSPYANPAFLNKTERQAARRSSGPAPPPSPVPVPPAKVGSHLPPQRSVIHGILKQPPAGRASPQPLPTEGPDAWGVKAVSISSSRPQPKLKAMFHLWRSSEGKTSALGPNRVRSPQQTETLPLLPKKDNPRASLQKLRFVEGVQVIPRPAIDSDPYEEEEEEDEEEFLPPSPRRGSILWTQRREEPGEEDEADGGRAYGITNRTVSPMQLPEMLRGEGDRRRMVLVDEKGREDSFPSSRSPKLSTTPPSPRDPRYAPRAVDRTEEGASFDDDRRKNYALRADLNAQTSSMSEPENSTYNIKTAPAGPRNPASRGMSADRVMMQNILSRSPANISDRGLLFTR